MYIYFPIAQVKDHGLLTKRFCFIDERRNCLALPLLSHMTLKQDKMVQHSNGLLK